MHRPSDDTNGLYRDTLRAIRSGIGANRYLLGCWGLPIEGAGHGWFTHRRRHRARLGWFSSHCVPRCNTTTCTTPSGIPDPDVVIVRSPLTLDQARVWATLQGLTGQALMSSDRLMDLSAERVELLKRIYPAVDIRPLDLFPVEKTNASGI